MEKVLITGGTGFIGKNVVKKMSSMGFEIHLIVRKDSNTEEFNNLNNVFFHTYNGEVEEMIEIVEKSRAEVVIHLASLFLSEHSIKDIDKLISSNIILGTHLMEAAKLGNVNYMINAGTVWQNYLGKDYNPVNLYAATKEAFEKIAKYYTQISPLRMITLKIYDTYGIEDKRPKILSLLSKIKATGGTLNMSKGEQLLGMVFIDDIVEAFLVAVSLIKTKAAHYQETFYLTPCEFYSLREIVKIYESVMNAKLNINWGQREYRAREVMNPYVGERLPGWIPKVDLVDGFNSLK